MLIRKLFRTAISYRSQFISMIIMVAIGMGVFLGFHMEWYSIQYNTEQFYQDTKFADYRIYKESGFTKKEIESIQKLDGIDAASRVFSANVDVEENNTSLVLFSVEDYLLSQFLTLDGETYNSESSDFWLSDKYAKANDISIGDTIRLSYRGMQMKGNVAGIGKSSEHIICVADENQLMPDLEKFGFVYISPKALEESFGMDYYPQINIRSSMKKQDLEMAIKKAIGTTTLVTGKEEHMGYAGAQSEIEEGQTMGSVLPILFLAIAILTMITTMHRIAANEKIQIGTLKALGLKDRKILAHYTSYGLVLGIIGALLGIGIGYLIGGMIMNENGMMGTYLDMPSWKLVIPGFCWIILAATILFLTFIAFLSVKKMLKGTAAEALRPYVPKKIKPLFVERFNFWSKTGFSVRWNLRDIMRHKSRSIMSLIGIVGCMLLLVGAFGIKDTMKKYVRTLNTEINHYTTKVAITENADQAAVKDFAREEEGDWQASLGIKLKGETVSLEIYEINNDKIRFLTQDGKRTKLKNDGIYLCGRLADKADVGDTISISPYGSTETYKVKVAGVVRSLMTKSVMMTADYASKMEIPYQINSVYTDATKAQLEKKTGKNVDFISGIQSKKEIMDTYDNFMEVMNLMVYLFTLAAIVLGIVVLYNLGVMSYIERSRELATLKVVGFKDKHIRRILISQNIWLTVTGILIGLPGGYGVLKILIVLLADEYELDIFIRPVTYLFSILLTFGVSLFVGYFVSAKNKKIDMVEALKGRE